MPELHHAMTVFIVLASILVLSLCQRVSGSVYTLSHKLIQHLLDIYINFFYIFYSFLIFTKFFDPHPLNLPFLLCCSRGELSALQRALMAAQR